MSNIANDECEEPGSKGPMGMDFAVCNVDQHRSSYALSLKTRAAILAGPFVRYAMGVSAARPAGGGVIERTWFLSDFSIAWHQAIRSTPLRFWTTPWGRSLLDMDWVEIGRQVERQQETRH